jgi:hypothetical protein
VAIGFVGATTPLGANNGGNVTVGLTGLGLQQGDLVICFVASSGTADQVMSTTSSGWTKRSDVYANGTIDTNLAAFWKIMGASPDSSFVGVGPGGSSNATIAGAIAFDGIDPASPFIVADTTATGTATSVPNPPSLTTGDATAAVVAAGAGVAGTGAAFTSASLTGFVSANHAETNDCALGYGYSLNKSGFDPAAFGGGNVNAANSWAAMTLGLKPLAATTHAGDAALSGAGTIAAVGRRTQPGAVGISGAGTLAASGAILKLASAVLAGTGTLAALGTSSLKGAFAANGSSTMAAVPKSALKGVSALSGSGTVVAAAQVMRSGRASVSGTGTAAFAPAMALSGTCTLAGAGQFTSSATLSGSGTAHQGQASVSGTGLLVAAAGDSAFRRIAHPPLTPLWVSPDPPAKCTCRKEPRPPLVTLG